MNLKKARLPYLLAFLAAIGCLGAAALATAAEPAEHTTSTSVKCEPTEGAVGAVRTCTVTVTDTNPSIPPASPNGQVQFTPSVRCSLTPATSNTSTCSAQATPNAQGTYNIEVFFPGGVGSYSSNGTGTLIAGAPSATPVSNSSLTWAGNEVPTITLEKKPPKKTRSRVATFTFSSDQATAHFECRAETFDWEACTSPKKKKVGVGTHVFRIRVVSSTGSYGAKAVVWHWRVLPRK